MDTSKDRIVSRSELFPLVAPLKPLEHCIGDFLDKFVFQFLVCLSACLSLSVWQQHQKHFPSSVSTDATRTATARSPSKSGAIVSRFPTRTSKTFATASSLITSASRAERQRQITPNFFSAKLPPSSSSCDIASIQLDLTFIVQNFLKMLLLHTVACTRVEISKNRKETLFDKLISSLVAYSVQCELQGFKF